jgi:hypothetical protein
MQVTKHILVQILCGDILGFLLSFYANSISFFFNQLSISTFFGFHGLNIHFYIFILFMILSRIPLTQSCVVLANNITIFWLLISLPTYWADPGLDLNKLPTNPSKTIDPSGNPEGNTTHKVYCAVSLEIVLWVAAMLRCLQSSKDVGIWDCISSS